MKGTSYYTLLSDLHRALRPRVYLEIGFKRGRSALCALPETQVIAVDPRPLIERPLPANVHVEQRTSDDFFAGDIPAQLLGGRQVDVGFIDGKHLIDFALRDFFNLERLCHQQSVILIHDCLPREAAHATKQPIGTRWAGDVWKAVYYLLRERTDLTIHISTVGPTGMAIVSGLGRPAAVTAPSAEHLAWYDALTFEDYEATLPVSDRVVGAEWADLRHLFPKAYSS